MAMATNHDEIPPSQEDLHQPQPYHPSLWGDFFLDHTPCTPEQYLAMKDDAEVKKEELRKMILDSRSSDLPHKLELVDMLERLGLAYHYAKEIDNLLQDIHDARDQDCDLPTTALQFYLLRKHGYHISSDVFLKFKDNQGNIATNDTRCLQSLYDAAHLRIHGEEILDDAIAFTKNRLHTMIEYLEPELAKEVHHALETPLFRRFERVEARRCISVYEKNTTRNETMLELAKLDFNILLTLYCKELKDLTLWWKEFQAQTNIKYFARDRMVELHFWMLGVFYEPQYSYSRIMLTKLVTITSLFDDLYDNYSTTEESYFFTTALERWDEQATEQLPTYLRTFYINVFTTVNAIEQELKLQNNKHAELVKNVVINMAKSYLAEVKWRDEHYVPANIEEHFQISVCSSACMQIANHGFISMGEVATIEAIEWAFTYPKIIKAVCIIGRIVNDIMSHQREQASKHVVSTVQTFMKEYGITVEQANEKLKGIVEEAWMDITEACLKPQQPMALLERVVNLARTMDFFYKHEDAYTDPHSLKGTMDSVYLDLL